MRTADIQTIKERNEIGSTVERYLSLRWKGEKGQGICPFHDDHHPSLTVDRAQQRFICFACGAQGDVIEFVRRMEGCDFQQALGKLGGYGVQPPGRKEVRIVPQPGNSKAGRQPLPDHTLFLKLLMPYVAENRELLATYQVFEVGLSPHLVPELYRAQKNRIIFPVRDENGVLRGFSARSRETGGGKAKYIHTPSSQGFHSSEILYGLWQGRESILRSDFVFLTEGFKDVLAMHGAEFTRCVALMGTSLSHRHIELLKRYTRREAIVMDGDGPGREATEKIAGQLMFHGFLVSGVDLPDGEHPDSLLQKWGTAKFREFIREQVRVEYPYESMLTAACLMYGNCVMELHQAERPFRQIVAEMLENEQLEPESPLNRQLLKAASAACFPEHLQEAEKRCKEQQQRTMEQLTEELLPRGRRIR